MSECASKGCGCTTEPIIQPTAPAPLATGSAQAVYRIENMDCPTEEALIRSKLAGLAGVAGLEFNLMQRTLAVQHELPSLSPVEQALKAIGMQAVRMDQASAEQTTKLSIAKMDCPTEETLIRNKLGTVAGVADLDFNLMQRTLSVRHANQVLPDVLVALQALGFEAQVVDTAEVASPSAAPVTTPTNWWPLGISLVTASAAEAVYWLHNGNHWSVVVLALVAVFTGGLSTYKKACHYPQVRPSSKPSSQAATQAWSFSKPFQSVCHPGSLSCVRPRKPPIRATSRQYARTVSSAGSLRMAHRTRR